MGPAKQIHLTDHVQLRWVMRTLDIEADIEQIWEDSIPIEAPDHVYSEARYHPEGNTVLLLKGDGLATVLLAENVDFEIIEQRKTCPTCGNHQKAPEPGDTCTKCRLTITNWID